MFNVAALNQKKNLFFYSYGITSEETFYQFPIIAYIPKIVYREETMMFSAAALNQKNLNS